MRRLLLTLIAVMFAWAALVVLTGGIEWHIAGVLFRSRDPGRALVLGLLLLLAYAILFPAALARHIERGVVMVRTAAPALAATVAALLALHGIVHGTFTAGSSDSYGYISQAYGWVSGDLPHSSPLPLNLPSAWPDQVQVPLAYTLGVRPHTMVPVCAPGLPMLMAAGVLAAGPIGPYLIVPIFAALFVWFTFLLGRMTAGRTAGVIAALLVALSPAVLFQTLWPMTDVPVAACWTAAAVAALKAQRRDASVSGLWAMLALLIRPNLVPLVVLPLAAIVLTASWRERIVRGALFMAPILPAAILIAILNTSWYGAPTTSGYGTAADLYSVKDIWPNLQHYGLWLWQSQSPWILLAAAPFVLSRRAEIARAPLWMSAALFIVTLLCYVAYLQFDAWWFLRFLLPGLGAFFVLLAAGIVTLSRRIVDPWGRIAALAIIVLITRHVTSYAIDKGVFGTIKTAERRYIYVGDFVRTLPATAVVLTMQHSGSIRFYSGRMTLRYDWIPTEWTSNAVAELERRGYHPYLAIDDWETPIVQKQFNLSGEEPLPWRLIAQRREYGGVSVFDMSSSAIPSAAPVDLASGDAPWYRAPEPLSAGKATHGS